MPYAPFKFFGKNNAGRDFVVGDIHGMFSALERLLARLHFNASRDRVFAVGDLIDRGPESHRVIEFLNYPWFHSVMGNHEKMLLESVDSSAATENWTLYNGGDWWLRIPSRFRPRIHGILEQLPLAFEVSTAIGRVGIVHADVPTGMSWKTFVQGLFSTPELADYALWSRNRYKNLKITHSVIPVEGIDLVVFGHTPLGNPLQAANLYYIDTGAALTDDKALGMLTALQIHPTLQVHQISTRGR